MARSRFVATMSHEIRTPLGGLLGMIDLLSMDETDPSKLELLNYAKAAGNGLSRIVNDVLDFSKMEAGVFVFEEEHVDIRALAESARMLYASHGKGIGRSILAKIDSSVPRLFLSDATRIRQVISNLLSNALRYSTEGPIILRAKATPHEKDNFVLLHVAIEDFGIGIPADKISSLFKDFSQVANPLTAAAQGTGLGLAICKRIMEGIGGRIGVETSPGEGSTFWFEVAVEVVSMMSSDSPTGRDKAHEVVSDSIAGKRVLIAEDNIINQRLLLAYTERLGLVVDLAENGRIAFEKFAPGKYDLLLMDIAMPEMDGLEATRRIREKWPKGSVPPVIALTAHVADAIEEEAKMVGIDRVMSKPIPFEDLKLALIAALNLPQPMDAGNLSESQPAVQRSSESILMDIFPPAVAKEHLELLSEEELLDLTGKFVADCSMRIEKLLDADRQGEAEEVTQQAHSLKGACLALGFTELADWARRIELREREPGPTKVDDLANKFASEINRLTSILG
jgi:CheY-like chemotaxis protein/HPt (histidine-containing phosphotransfer) domain-containing protein